MTKAQQMLKSVIDRQIANGGHVIVEKPAAHVIAARIEVTDTCAILMGRHYKSYCTGSDALVALGLWDNDGQITDIGHDVIAYIKARTIA
jgi:hypothetical protein